MNMRTIATPATIIIVVAITVSVTTVIIILLILLARPWWRGRQRPDQRLRKQLSRRRRVQDELQHNVRYNSPDSLQVHLSGVQPRAGRRQTLPAISLCQEYQQDTPAYDVMMYNDVSANELSPPPTAPPSSRRRRTSYGSIELIRTKMRRFSEGAPTFESNTEPNYNGSVRKISLDSSVLSRICEESAELYHAAARSSNRCRRSSSSCSSSSTNPVFDSASSSPLLPKHQQALVSDLDLDLYSSSDELSASAVANTLALNGGNIFSNINSVDRESAAMSAATHSCGVGLGRLYFSLTYNHDLQNLYVTISKATYVRTSLAKEMSCIYVKVTLLPIELGYTIQRTNCVTSMGSPMFNQTFTFHIQTGDNSDATSVTTLPKQLQMTVKETRKFDTNRVIGYVWFDLASLLQQQQQQQTYSVAGCYINTGEIVRDIFGENKLFKRRGDVLISLRVMPYFGQGGAALGEIEVSVREARNLLTRHHNDTAFVRVSLLVDNKVAQTKKGQALKIRGTSPCFNEKFRFIVPNLSTSARTLSFEKDVYILLCFCGRGRMRMNSHLLGRSTLGAALGSPGDGSLLWSEALCRPGQRASQWLSLT